MSRYLVVMIGGAAGSAVRYAVGTAIMSRYPGRFPLGTFIVNITGSFLIGLAMTILMQRSQPLLRLLLVTGLLGGYTTFSAFEWEAYATSPTLAAIYLISSVMFGYAACWGGAWLGRMIQ